MIRIMIWHGQIDMDSWSISSCSLSCGRIYAMIGIILIPNSSYHIIFYGTYYPKDLGYNVIILIILLL